MRFFPLPPFFTCYSHCGQERSLCTWVAELNLLRRVCSPLSVIDSQIPTVRKGRAHSPVAEVGAKCGGGAARGSARSQLGLCAWQGPSARSPAQGAVNYYPYSPEQGSVRNLSHSLCLSACWECLLSFLGAADRNTPLLSDTHLETWIDITHWIGRSLKLTSTLYPDDGWVVHKKWHHLGMNATIHLPFL